MGELQGEFLSMYSMADYEAAINAAPPGTMIKLGDLDKAFVTCTTCNGKMPVDQAQFHKHLQDCPHCGKTIDINMTAHDPVIESKKAGAGDITYTTGCTERTL
jgi:predicted RNA-binding Zn-ribbon protein involved in translation (DUF1610 family)